MPAKPDRKDVGLVSYGAAEGIEAVSELDERLELAFNQLEAALLAATTLLQQKLNGDSDNGEHDALAATALQTAATDLTNIWTNHPARPLPTRLHRLAEHLDILCKALEIEWNIDDARNAAIGHHVMLFAQLTLYLADWLQRENRFYPSDTRTGAQTRERVANAVRRWGEVIRDIASREEPRTWYQDHLLNNIFQKRPFTSRQFCVIIEAFDEQLAQDFVDAINALVLAVQGKSREEQQLATDFFSTLARQHVKFQNYALSCNEMLTGLCDCVTPEDKETLLSFHSMLRAFRLHRRDGFHREQLQPALDALRLKLKEWAEVETEPFKSQLDDLWQDLYAAVKGINPWSDHIHLTPQFDPERERRFHSEEAEFFVGRDPSHKLECQVASVNPSFSSFSVVVPFDKCGQAGRQTRLKFDDGRSMLELSDCRLLLPYDKDGKLHYLVVINSDIKDDLDVRRTDSGAEILFRPVAFGVVTELEELASLTTEKTLLIDGKDRSETQETISDYLSEQLGHKVALDPMIPLYRTNVDPRTGNE